MGKVWYSSHIFVGISEIVHDFEQKEFIILIIVLENTLH